MTQDEQWTNAARETVDSYRKMIDAAIDQLSDEELWYRPSNDINSVAVILRHLGGNLQSRWTDFLTTDGEKATRNREAEFCDWEGDRESLMAYLNEGWSRLEEAIDQLCRCDTNVEVKIRGEAHTLPQAVARSITHIAYHAGQIALIARTVHEGDWQWLTIAPGASETHNKNTWGTKASRSIFGGP